MRLQFEGMLRCGWGVHVSMACFIELFNHSGKFCKALAKSSAGMIFHVCSKIFLVISIFHEMSGIQIVGSCGYEINCLLSESFL